MFKDNYEPLKTRKIMSNCKISQLKAQADVLFEEVDKFRLKADRHNYLKIKKIYAELTKLEPGKASNYMWLAVANYRLGKMNEAILYYDKAYSLLDHKSVKPAQLIKRARDPIAIAKEYIMEKAGNATFDIFQPARKVSSNRWAVPIMLKWKALRLNAEDYDKEMHLDCGEILMDRDENIIDGRAAELYRMAFHSYSGAFEVRKGKDCFTCIYPHRYGRIMLARLIKRSGLEKGQVSEKGNQAKRTIEIGKYRIIVENYENIFSFYTDPRTFFSILGLNKTNAFHKLQNPSVIVAFNRPIAVEPCVDSDNADAVLLKPGINHLFRAEFNKLKSRITGPKEYPLEKAYEFDYEKSSLLPEVKPFTARDLKDDIFVHPKLDADTGKLQFKASLPEVQGFVESQYRSLLDSIWPTPVKGKFNGKPFTGRVMDASTPVYGCTFLHDAFRNNMPMIYFDSESSKELMLTMLRYGTDENGAFGNGKCGLRAADCQWSLLIWALYDHCRDKEWLSAIYELLEKQDAYWDKYRYIRETGLYTGMFSQPDYDWGAPGWDSNVFCAGLNSTLYMFKMLKARIAKELGNKADKNLEQAGKLHRRINELMWDDNQGFYFNYDAEKKKIFQASSPDHFLKSGYVYKLHNLIPLYCGVPDQAQAERMMGVLTNQALYGRFRGVIETLSGSCCDERQFRVWPFFNWLIIQGLRMYGLHRAADRVSTDLYNMCFRAWQVYDDFPECYDATHGYLPEENVYTGGIGTISVPLLLILDRIGIYYSSRPETLGFQTRSVKESGIGDISFNCLLRGRPSRVKFQNGQGLTIR